MKLYQLFERHEYEDILQKASNALADVIVDKAQNEDLPTLKLGNTERYGTGDIGKLKDIIGSKVLGNLYNRLGNVTVSTIGYSSSEGGNYNYIDKSQININVNTLVGLIYNQNLDDILPRLKQQLSGVIVHELKHALDDSQSGRRITLKGPGGLRNALRRPTKHSSGDQEYLRRQTEVNARLSEVAKEIADKVRGREDVDNQTLMDKIILPTLRKYQLADDIFKDDSSNPMRGIREIFGRAIEHRSSYPLDNKFFRKLVGRMYSYARSQK